MAHPTAGGKNIARKHPEAKGPQFVSPVPLVIQPTENGTYRYPLEIPA